MRTEFFSADLQEWIQASLTGFFYSTLALDWLSCWAIIGWHIWNCRNKEVHELNVSRPMRSVQCIRRFVDQVTESMSSSCSMDRKVLGSLDIAWSTPPAGWIKLNTDGALKPNVPSAGCGGLLRDSSGNRLTDFAKPLCVCSAFQAECWGIITDLQVAWDLGYRNLQVERDSKALVATIRSPYPSPNYLVRMIQQKLDLLWEVEVLHTYREGNTCADWLANFSLSLAPGLFRMSFPPHQLRSLLLADGLAVFTRLVTLL